MTIKTKFNIGDEVWVIHNNKPICAMVHSIIITYRSTMPKEEYYLSLNSNFLSYPSNLGERSIIFKPTELFKTKQELLKSL